MSIDDTRSARPAPPPRVVDDPRSRRRRRFRRGAAVVVAAVLLLGGGRWWHSRTEPPPALPAPRTAQEPEGQTLAQREGSGAASFTGDRSPTGRVEIAATCRGAGDLVVLDRESGARLAAFLCFAGGVAGYAADVEHSGAGYVFEAPEALEWRVFVSAAAAPS